MKLVEEITFETELIREYSYKPEVDKLGRFKATMRLYTESGKIIADDFGTIEWENEGIDNPDGYECVGIGVWWDKDMNLTDYDGIMGYPPKEAIELLEKHGIKVDDEFRPDENE